MSHAASGHDEAPGPRRRRGTVVVGLLVAAAAVGGAVLAVALLGRAGLPERATVEGETVTDVWRFVLGLAGAVAGTVLSLLVVAFVQSWRDRHGPEPEQVRGNTVAELVYTAIPLVLVAAVFVVSLQASDDMEAAAGQEDVTIEVTGFQWGWRFDYADGPLVVGASPEEPELVLPVDRTVVFELRSEDVIHSFFSPAFLTKVDVVPGRENRLFVRPSREGTYRGHCAEFCGLDHARMGFTVRIVSVAEYEAWVDSTAGEAR